MLSPTRQILDNPDQHLRYMRGIVQALTEVVDTLPNLAAGIAAVPTPTHPEDWLSQNGQKALTYLNIDPSSTARRNIANVPPTADNDSTQGFSHFSQWIDTTGPTLYTCIDPSPGAAVWV